MLRFRFRTRKCSFLLQLARFPQTFSNKIPVFFQTRLKNVYSKIKAILNMKHLHTTLAWKQSCASSKEISMQLLFEFMLSFTLCQCMVVFQVSDISVSHPHTVVFDKFLTSMFVRWFFFFKDFSSFILKNSQPKMCLRIFPYFFPDLQKSFHNVNKLFSFQNSVGTLNVGFSRT